MLHNQVVAAGAFNCTVFPWQIANEPVLVMLGVDGLAFTVSNAAEELTDPHVPVILTEYEPTLLLFTAGMV